MQPLRMDFPASELMALHWLGERQFFLEVLEEIF